MKPHSAPEVRTPAAVPAPPADPAVVLDLLEAFRRSKTMFAAVKLGIFDALAGGGQSLSALAAALQLDVDAAERLFDSCVALGLLTRSAGNYENTPAANVYLTSDSPHRMTGYINYSNDVMWSLWAHLEDAVREGTNRWKQAYGLDGPIFSHLFRDDTAKREFLMGMHGFGMLSSPHVVAAFDLGRFKRFVDLGGATGHLAVAACHRYASLSAVVFDLPAVLPLAREIVGGTPVAARIEFAPGDFFNDPLPEGDIVALGRIVHDWSEPKVLKLLTRIYEQLPSGGALLLAEKLLAPDKCGPRWAQMQSLNMLICTEGKERTLDEYRAVLERVGFADVQGVVTTSPLDAIMAVKPD